MILRDTTKRIAIATKIAVLKALCLKRVISEIILTCLRHVTILTFLELSDFFGAVTRTRPSFNKISGFHKKTRKQLYLILIVIRDFCDKQTYWSVQIKFEWNFTIRLRVAVLTFVAKQMIIS